MGDRVRQFAKRRLAEQTGSKAASLDLRKLEQQFVDKFSEKFQLTERDIARAFKRFDKDGSGFLDLQELTSAISVFLNGINRADVEKLVQRYDVDGDGSISLEEFSAFLISRTNPNKDEWLTVDKLQAARPSQGEALDDSLFSAEGANEADEAEEGENANPQSAQHKAKIFLTNMKAMLLRKAVELKMEGKIALFDRLTKHANPLAESTARSMISKAFLPFMKNGTRVDFTSFSRVLLKFTYPGSPPPRSDVAQWLFKSCGGSEKRGADPDVLVDMVFDEGGVRINKWGFIQPVPAASELGRLEMGKGPIVRKAAQGPASIRDVAFRFQTRRCHTALAAPSDFDPALLDRSTQLPSLGLKKSFVYGLSANLHSGEPIVALPAPPSSSSQGTEVVFAAAALVVIHSLATNTQRYFEGHDDDVTCFAVSCVVPSSDTALVASGQLGHAPEVLIWEAALRDFVSTPSPQLTAQQAAAEASAGGASPPRGRRVASGQSSPDRGGRAAARGDQPLPNPKGLLARIGRGFFSRCVVAVGFSCDGAFVSAIGGDDKHAMGVWAVSTGDLLCTMPTANGIPPQIKSLSWSPASGQDTSFIAQDHLDFDCDLLVTTGEASNIKFWSFKRPNRAGLGAMLANRLHSLGKAGAPAARVFTCSAFVPQAFTGNKGPAKSSLEDQFDVVTGGDNGYLYVWRGATCVAAAQVLSGPGGVTTVTCLGNRLYAGGAKGAVVIVDAATLAPVLTLNALAGIGATPASAFAERAGRGSAGEGAAGTVTKRPPSAPPGTAGGFGIFSGRGDAVDQAVAPSKSLGLGRRTASAGAGGGKGKAPTSATAAKPSWGGPGQKVDTSVEAGVSGSSALLGLAVLPADRPSSSDRGAGAEGSKTPVLLVTTGSGRAIKMQLPTARELALAANTPAGASALPQPETSLFFHYGPVWAVAEAPAGTASLNTPVFASGGDDAWLCVWDGARRKLLTRAKSPASVRSLGFGPAPRQGEASVVAVGMVSGILGVFLLSSSKPSSSSSSSSGAAGAAAKMRAFERAETLVLNYSLTECACRRDCREEISDVKFAPSGKLLAAANHDNYIDVYSVLYVPASVVVAGLDKASAPARVELKPVRRLRGHSSYVSHIDWSLDSKLLRSTCGAYELLFWDVAAGKQALSSADSLEGDTRWATETVSLGFGVMGIWPNNAKGTDINAVDCNADLGLCVTGDDSGKLTLFNYPCIVADAPSKLYSGHSSHVLGARFVGRASPPSGGVIGGGQAQQPVVVTVGGNDAAVIQWAIGRDASR